jgi:hypothetical protein
MTHFVAAAMNPKTAARRMQLAESPSQSTFKEFAAKGARSEAEMADKILLKAEACIKAPTASSRASAKRNRGKVLKEKKVSFRRIYNLRSLSLLLFMISAPSVLSAVNPSVAAEPRRVIRVNLSARANKSRSTSPENKERG